MPKVRWEEMFPDELDAALARCPVVYVPLGLCEPHGLHNALGLDALKWPGQQRVDPASAWAPNELSHHYLLEEWQAQSKQRSERGT